MTFRTREQQLEAHIAQIEAQEPKLGAKLRDIFNAGKQLDYRTPQVISEVARGVKPEDIQAGVCLTKRGLAVIIRAALLAANRPAVKIDDKGTLIEKIRLQIMKNYAVIW